jgi:hypothetical protein
MNNRDEYHRLFIDRATLVEYNLAYLAEQLDCHPIVVTFMLSFRRLNV